jgi:hypothetical protein
VSWKNCYRFMVDDAEKEFVVNYAPNALIRAHPHSGENSCPGGYELRTALPEMLTYGCRECPEAMTVEKSETAP